MTQPKMYYTAGQYSATVKKDPENFDEYKVQFYIGGVAEGTGYFTPDLDDAQDTAKAECDRGNERDIRQNLLIKQIMKDQQIVDHMDKKDPRDEFRSAAIDAVKKTLKARKESGALVNEADYIMGALAVMQLVDVNTYGADPEQLAIMPPAWMFGIMRGESINGGDVPANIVLIETWTEQDPDGDGYEKYKCRRITAPNHLEVEERDLDAIREEYSGDDLEMELDEIRRTRKSINGRA